MNPLVSIIVPVYKVEPYFEQCMASLLNQTLRNIEIILIDDGSPDNCPEMCDRFAAEDVRVRVRHQKNAGVSVSRNAGIELARGQYIMFVDSDDWLEPDAVEELYENALETGCEIVFASFYQNFADRQKDSGMGDPSIKYIYEADKYRNYLLAACFVTPYRAASLFPEQMQCCAQLGTPWIKLYSAEFLRHNKLRFPSELSLGEDRIFNLQAFYSCSSVSFTNKRIYHYRMRSTSAAGNIKGQIQKIMLQYDCFKQFMLDFGLTEQLTEYLHLSIATDIIKLMQSFYQDEYFKENFRFYFKQIKEFMKNDLAKKAVRDVRLEYINKYKLMFRLLKLRLCAVTILVYRLLCLCYPEKYGKKKYG